MATSRGLRILQAGGRGEFQNALRAEGHVVESAPDGPTAVARARATCQDVVVLRLDGIDGDPFALAKEIRAAGYWRRPMFIAISLPGRKDCEVCFRDAGIDLLLLEPVPSRILTEFSNRLRAVVSDF